LIIRAEQLAVFKRRAVLDFVLRMRQHLQSTFPERIGELSSEDLDDRIEAAIATGKEHGLVRECDVEGYLNVMCASGDLGKQPPSPQEPPDWVRKIVEDPGIPDESKVDALYTEYGERQRDGIK
jgi:hypothetical protein